MESCEIAVFRNPPVLSLEITFQPKSIFVCEAKAEINEMFKNKIKTHCATTTNHLHLLFFLNESEIEQRVRFIDLCKEMQTK